MFRSTLARLLLGTAALGVAGGTTALAAPASPGTTPTGPATPARPHDVARAVGKVVMVQGNDVTIARRDRGQASRNAAPAAPAADRVTVELNAETVIYRSGDPASKLGHDAVKVGVRVAVRYTSSSGRNVARRVVLLPDLRRGTVIEKGADYIRVKTVAGDTIRVTVTDKTAFFTGRRGKAKGTFADVREGERVRVAGWPDGADNFDALRVHYWAPDRGRVNAGATATATPGA